MRLLLLSLALAFDLTCAAQAAVVMPNANRPADAAVRTVGEGCGPGRWRGPQGGCNTFGGPYGIARGTRFECPLHYHLGPRSERCFPNR